jgi:phenylalanyl-tRNA synthetase beta chain
MKVPLSWLKDYVDITVSPEEVAHRLTMAGTEVEKIERTADWDNVVVGHVKSVQPHPNADRLRLVTVFNGESEVEVVCGAPNVADGQTIAYASIGAVLVDAYSDEPGATHTLKRSKIRGVESHGMVCSEKELGLSGEHEGILVLETDAEPGTPLGDVLGDVGLDAELTPNRPDCLGIVGIARETAVLTGQELRSPPVDYAESAVLTSALATVRIDDPDLCPRYTATVISGVKIGPSPAWLADRLRAIGEGPINNIVDVTNYVMFELGQPLHAFDYDRVVDHTVIVRRAQVSEKLVTLDGKERKLDGDMLLIADPEKGIGLAGVMGGANSEIGDSTTKVFLESATFNGSNNRRTSNLLELRSQATLRFEKGLRSGLAEIALRRATRLILEIAGGEAASGIIDEHPGKNAEQQSVSLTDEKLARVLGTEVDRERVSVTLSSLGFDVTRTLGGWEAQIPYWRPDVTIPEDLIEEVARVIGYDEIPVTTPAGHVPSGHPRPEITTRNRVADALARAGMQEIISYAATSESNEERVPLPGVVFDHVRMLNPVSADHAVMRRTVRESVLNAVSRNLHTWRGPIALFEIGHVFGSAGEGLPHERVMVVGAFAGPSNDVSWAESTRPADFFDAKGAVEAVFAEFHTEGEFVAAEDPALTPGRTAEVTVSGAGGIRVGVVGELRCEVLDAFDIDGAAVSMFELELEALQSVAQAVGPADIYSLIVRYQDSARDLALLVDMDVPAAKVTAIARKSRLVSSATVFDVFDGKGLPKGKKSLAVRVVYQSPKKTLTAEDLAKAEAGILRALESQLGATLRS